MFALKFDDLKRKLAPKGVELHDIATAAKGTEDWDVWMGVYLMPENVSLHLVVEDDETTHTFYTIHVQPKVEEENLKPELLTVRKLNETETDQN